MAARSTSSLSTDGSSTRRTAPPTTSDTVTPASGRAQSAVRSPSMRTTRRRGPLVAKASTVPDATRLPTVDDRHHVAQILHQVELVAAEQHATPRAGLVDQHLADGVDAGRDRALTAARRARAVLGRAPARRLAGRAAGSRATRSRPSTGADRRCQALQPRSGSRPCACEALSPCSRPTYSTCSPTSMPGYSPCSSGM